MQRNTLLRLVAGALVVTAPLAFTSARAGAAAPKPAGHVFVIVLENENAETSFGPGSAAPYLAHELVRRGVFVRNYYGIGHASLDNYVALISGQPPNAVTQGDCAVYTDVTPGTVGSDGIAIGQGCVYPRAVPTIAEQLDAVGKTWKGYMEDMGNSKTGEPATCRHPAANTPDGDQAARVGDQYAPRHNPFVYFHSITDTPRCDRNVVPLERLPGDLTRVESTPNFTFITPNLCHDGHDAPCVNNEPGGLASADQFLQTWVPRITSSPAYRRDGMLAVIFDEAAAGQGGDSTACCQETAGPNTLAPGITGAGGGRTGAVIMGPGVRVGAVSLVAYNHYSLLRSIEDLFDVPHLAEAARAGLVPFGADIFRLPSAPVPLPTVPVSPGASARVAGSTTRSATLPATGVPVAPALAAGMGLLLAGIAARALSRPSPGDNSLGDH